WSPSGKRHSRSAALHRVICFVLRRAPVLRKILCGAPRNHSRVARLAMTSSAMAHKAHSRDHAVLCLIRAWAKPSHHISPLIDGHGSPAHEQRDDQQGLRLFYSPSDNESEWTINREMDEDLQQDGVCQVPWLQTLIVEQARQPLRRRFLIAKMTSQLG